MQEKTRWKKDYGLEDIYKLYKKEYSKKSPKHNIDKKTHTKVIKAFNKAISQMILEKSYDFVMPHRVGTLRIKKLKTIYRIVDGKVDYWKSRVYVDWKKTKEMWEKDPSTKEGKYKKLVYATNEHTDGRRFRWCYSKYRSNIPNHTAYCFIPSRANARALANILKTNPKIDYFE